MCDQSAEQQRDGLTRRQEQAMGTHRCRRGLPYGAKSLHSGEEREYHVRVGVPNRKFRLVRHTPTENCYLDRLCSLCYACLSKALTGLCANTEVGEARFPPVAASSWSAAVTTSGRAKWKLDGEERLDDSQF